MVGTKVDLLKAALLFLSGLGFKVNVFTNGLFSSSKIFDDPLDYDPPPACSVNNKLILDSLTI